MSLLFCGAWQCICTPGYTNSICRTTRKPSEYFGGCAHTYLLKTLSAMSGHCNFRVPKKANTCWCRRYQSGNIQLYPGRILFHTSKWNTNITLITGRRSHQSCKSSRCLIFVRTQNKASVFFAEMKTHTNRQGLYLAQSPTKHAPKIQVRRLLLPMDLIGHTRNPI